MQATWGIFSLESQDDLLNIIPISVTWLRTSVYVLHMHICNYITAAKLIHAQFCTIKFHSTHKSSFFYRISDNCCGVFYKSYIGSTLIFQISGQVPKCRLRASVFQQNLLLTVRKAPKANLVSVKIWKVNHNWPRW